MSVIIARNSVTSPFDLMIALVSESVKRLFVTFDFVDLTKLIVFDVHVGVIVHEDVWFPYLRGRHMYAV